MTSLELFFDMLFAVVFQVYHICGDVKQKKWSFEKRDLHQPFFIR